MKYALSLAAVLAALISAPAFAGEGHVPQSTLNNLGLSGMEILSDEQGQEVRGLSGNAMSMGLSIVTGLLIDPHTKSFVFGADANAASSSAENAGLQALTQAAHIQSSSMTLDLNVSTTSFGTFTGLLIGGAGGSGMASSQ